MEVESVIIKARVLCFPAAVKGSVFWVEEIIMYKGTRTVGSITVWKSYEEANVARGEDGVSIPRKILLVQY